MIDAQGLLRSALIARSRAAGATATIATSVRERAAPWFYDAHHRVDRSLHAITRNRMLTGRFSAMRRRGSLISVSIARR